MCKPINTKSKMLCFKYFTKKKKWSKVGSEPLSFVLRGQALAHLATCPETTLHRTGVRKLKSTGHADQQKYFNFSTPSKNFFFSFFVLPHSFFTAGFCLEFFSDTITPKGTKFRTMIDIVLKL